MIPNTDACLALAEVNDQLGTRVKEALDVIQDALDTYGYAHSFSVRYSLTCIREEKMSLSFNGGKDCEFCDHFWPIYSSLCTGTVLLHLYAAALDRWRKRREAPSAQPIPSIYIAPPSPFAELEAFISASEERYNLQLYRISGAMKYALEVYKDTKPSIEAILVGIRKGDPHGGAYASSLPLGRFS